MKSNNAGKMASYHYEEILLILFICSSDMAPYNDRDLILFAEDIEGRIEVLFDPDFLKSLNKFKVDEDVLYDFGKLRDLLVAMYESQWHKKMNNNNLDWQQARLLAQNILCQLNVEYVEPVFFAEHHLNLP